MNKSRSHFKLLDALPDFFAAQLDKARNNLKEFIRKQDHRQEKMSTPTDVGGCGSLDDDKSAFLAYVRSAAHVALYLRKSIPEALFQSLKELGRDAPKGTVEVVVEDLSDAGYLRSLYDAHVALFYGVGLPSSTTILIDRKRGFQLEPDDNGTSWRLTQLKNGEDLSLSMVWHKFGLAVRLRGTVCERDCSRALFCITTDGQRQQWCRFTKLSSDRLPEIGKEVDIFAWQKWYSGILEVLQLESADKPQAGEPRVLAKGE